MTTYRERADLYSEPDLGIEISRKGEAVVCSLAGALHMDNEELVRDALARALAQAPTLLAVDLSAVTLLTSSGLNALLTARRRADDDGVPMVLAAPSPQARRVLGITEADLVFPVYPSLERAARHSGASRTV
ncbi:STAS domain-containing protein [Kitasatospora sp. A2-31]|uniref:STAS domain-containing protein n=1 Tax=Kitasatospora sp. A2-31 TaxID=2916414 RepID=UPI001EEC0A8A|nr:STAS domain-containing protein [Kitasatospora sp. A2-31]MCG6494386.1 STAS domain-containing protein [Kitasatospora sp. A2-31]